MPVHESIRFNTPDKIEKLLRTPHGKGGDDHAAAAIKCRLQNIRKGPGIVRRGIVYAVAIGGFHHDIVRFVNQGRIAQQRLICVPNIAGEDHLALFAVFVNPDFDIGGTQQMPRVGKANIDSFKKREAFVITMRDELL
ncbi:hypothetical protein SDC9_195076 [bioreactor metagenome]|uniref:Uncharacterized protein n=1 Tax=bioreactor metagenome TaxID=1076179 RepID=A0A645IGP1_9ZZZZ